MSDNAYTLVNDPYYDMLCIGKDFEIRGDFDSDTASNLMVVIELCDPL